MRHGLYGMAEFFTPLLIVAMGGRSWGARVAGGILLGGLSYLVQHELRERGNQGRFWPVAVLVGNELDLNGSAIRGGVAVDEATDNNKQLTNHQINKYGHAVKGGKPYE